MKTRIQLYIFVLIKIFSGCSKDNTPEYRKQRTQARLTSAEYSIIKACIDKPSVTINSFSDIVDYYRMTNPNSIDALPQHDAWGTFFRLYSENPESDHRSFILCSAGPNSVWGDEDDIYHMFSYNLGDATPTMDNQPPKDE